MSTPAALVALLAQSPGYQTIGTRVWQGSVSGEDVLDIGGPNAAVPMGIVYYLTHKTADSDTSANDTFTAAQHFKNGDVTFWLNVLDHAKLDEVFGAINELQVLVRTTDNLDLLACGAKDKTVLLSVTVTTPKPA